MKEKINFTNLLSENSNFRNVCKAGEYIIYIFLFSQMVLNLAYAWESVFQNFKDKYLAIAIIYFMLAVLIIQKVKLLNFINVIVVLIIGCIAAVRLHALAEIPDVYFVEKYRWIGVALMCVSLIDMIMYKKIAKWKERNSFATISYGIIAISACLLSGGVCYSYLLICPIIFLFLLRITKEDFNNWILCFSIGYYAAFLYTMIKSFIIVPYTGERYYGIYINHGIFGIFIAGAFVCTLWWQIILIKRKVALWKRIVLFIPMIFAVICSLMNGARVGESAILIVALVAICIWGGSSEKKRVILRSVVVFVAVVILFGCGFLVLYILSTFEQEVIQAQIDNSILREILLYWNYKAKAVFGEESAPFGIIEGGTILNAIDQFSSWRLSYWIVYLREAGWEPASTWHFDVGEAGMEHPHNLYIYWIFGMGYIPGALLIIWSIIYFVKLIQGLMKGNELCVFSFLWFVYYLVSGINENPMWIMPVGFVVLILYYPIMMKFDESTNKAKKG